MMEHWDMTIIAVVALLSLVGMVALVTDNGLGVAPTRPVAGGNVQGQLTYDGGILLIDGASGTCYNATHPNIGKVESSSCANKAAQVKLLKDACYALYRTTAVKAISYGPQC
jgi:hypothetical protein